MPCHKRILSSTTSNPKCCHSCLLSALLRGGCLEGVNIVSKLQHLCLLSVFQSYAARALSCPCPLFLELCLYLDLMVLLLETGAKVLQHVSFWTCRARWQAQPGWWTSLASTPQCSGVAPPSWLQVREPPIAVAKAQTGGIRSQWEERTGEPDMFGHVCETIPSAILHAQLPLHTI